MSFFYKIVRVLLYKLIYTANIGIEILLVNIDYS